MQQQRQLIEMKRTAAFIHVLEVYSLPVVESTDAQYQLEQDQYRAEIEFGPLTIERRAMPSSKPVVVTPVYLECSSAFGKPGFPVHTLELPLFF